MLRQHQYKLSALNTYNKKMKVIVALCFVFVAAYALQDTDEFEVAEDDVGEQYFLVPVRRFRRQLDISKSGNGGTRITAGHGGTLYDNPNHRLDGSAFGSKTFKPSGPLTVGGRLDYTHKPSGSGLNVGAQHTRHFGTDVSAGANLNLYRSPDRRTTLDANGGYNRHFGGPFGTGKPNWNAGLNFNHRF